MSGEQCARLIEGGVAHEEVAVWPAGSDRRPTVAERAEAIIRLFRERPFTAILPYRLEPYSKDDGPRRRWIFRRNIIRNNLNYSAECRQRNDYLFQEGLLTFEEWEATDRLHHARELKLIHAIGALPPEERRELEVVRGNPPWPLW